MAGRSRLDNFLQSILNGRTTRSRLTRYSALLLVVGLAALQAADPKSSAQQTPACETRGAFVNDAPKAATNGKQDQPARPEQGQAKKSVDFQSTAAAGTYALAGGRHLIVSDSKDEPAITIRWPKSDRWPQCQKTIRVQPDKQGRWGVVWRADDRWLWWIDDQNIGKVRLDDPAEVLITTEGRRNNFSRDFELTDEHKQALGKFLPVGREGKWIGGNSGGQTSAAASVVDPWTVAGMVRSAGGPPVEGAIVEVRSEYRPLEVLAETKSAADGTYHLAFGVDLEALAKFRGVYLTARRAGMAETRLNVAGAFELFAAEPASGLAKTKAVYPPLRPGKIGTADFTLAAAATIKGRVIDPAGAPLAERYVALRGESEPPFHGTVASATTDKEGRFELADIPADIAWRFVTAHGPCTEAQTQPQSFTANMLHQLTLIVDCSGPRDQATLGTIFSQER